MKNSGIILPVEIINHNLRYDNRFTYKNNILCIKKPELNKNIKK